MGKEKAVKVPDKKAEKAELKKRLQEQKKESADKKAHDGIPGLQFNWIRIAMGIGLIAVGVIDYLGVYSFNKLVYNILLVLIGLWILKTTVSWAFTKRRSEIGKRLIH